MLRSRRFAFAAAALLVGLSACGDSSSRTVAGNSPVVIQLGESPSTGGGAQAATADKMMAPMQDITFVFDGDASQLGAAGPAWTLPGGGTPDAARVAKLAELLGVKGELREVPADQGGGWMIGAADYSTATLTVSTDGMLSWWFNPAPSTVASSIECVYVDPAVDVVVLDTDAVATTAVDPAAASTDAATTVGGDAVVAPPEGGCAAPVPPTNVPDTATAEAKAKQLFADMGYDNASYDFEIYADEWGANVTAYLLLDGMRSPISLSFGYGAEGVVTWASGSLAIPLPAGEYPLVGADGGVARLNDETGQWGGYWGGPMAMSRMEGGGTAEVSTASAGSAVAPVAVSDTAEPISVSLTGVKMGLTMIWAADNTIWLLPAYEFSAADGGQYTVIAVDDSFIQLPAPYPTETMPVDSMPVPTSPDTVATVVNSQAAAEAVGNTIVGLPLAEAIASAEAAGFTVRVTTLDGINQAITFDLRTDRLNVSVENGVVTGIDSIG